MKKNILYIAMLFLATFLLSSCGDDDDDVNPSTPTSNVVVVDYNIFEPTIWYSDSIYIVPNSVKIDASLLIQAGTLIKFHSGAGLEVWENGTIKAIGTKDSLIVFTAIKDDLGGDHNGDNNVTAPSAGDWDFVDLGYQNGSAFSFCVFMYGGTEGYTGVLELGVNTSTVEHCIFANNKSTVSSDEFYGALSAQNADALTVIRSNTFYNNTVPLSIDGHINIDNSNVFTNPDNEEEGNTYNGIFVFGQDIISSSPTWEETEVPFVILYDNFEIWNNYSLTLGDNVVLKFFTDSWLNLQNGTVLVNGQGTGVYFTSFKDDSKKGDTNGDGNTTNPPPANEWLGIYNGDSFYTWSNILYSKNAY